MHVQVTLTPPSRISALNGRKYSDKEYFAFCQANPDLRVERTAKGEIVVTPPAGYESDDRSAEVIAQLRRWANKDRRGRASGATAQFFLRDGSALSPAAWTSKEQLTRASDEEKRRFPHFCPEFVIEVLSPSDRIGAAKTKMEQWIANGVELGWLIDGDNQTIYIYEPGRKVEVKKGVSRLAGKGPVKGFVLQLRTIWEGLK